MMNQREALYSFVAWLSCRKQETKIGADNCCGGLPDLIERFADHHNLPGVTNQHGKNCKQHPGEKEGL